MVNQDYIPDRGDIVWVNFSPNSGHEQAGERPALVISPKEYSRISTLSLVCPITSKKKGYIYELPLLNSNNIRGYILVDQIRSMDYMARKFRFIEKSNPSLLKKVQHYLNSLISEEI